VYGSAQVTVDPALRTELESYPETDMARKLATDTKIEDGVAKQLYEDRAEARAALTTSLNSVPSLSVDRLGGEVADGGDSTLEMRKKVQALHKELTGRPRRGQLDSAGAAAREKLVECLVQNKSQPLNCREAFAAFQAEVTRTEEQIASQ